MSDLFAESQAIIANLQRQIDQLQALHRKAQATMGTDVATHDASVVGVIGGPCPDDDPPSRPVPA